MSPKLKVHYVEIDLPSVLHALDEGELDEHLDTLSQAVFDRKKNLSRKKARANILTMKPGDTVRIVGSIKPRYLQGEMAEVRPDSDWVEATGRDVPVGFMAVKLSKGKIRRYGPTVCLPAQLLLKVRDAG